MKLPNHHLPDDGGHRTARPTSAVFAKLGHPVKAFEKLPTHFTPDGSMMSFTMVVGAKRHNIAFSIVAIFTQWNYMMRLKIDFSIGHQEAGFTTPFTLAIGPNQNIGSNQ